MMTLNILILSISMSIILFISSSHPISMVMIVMMSTILISLLMGMNLASFWICYLLILIYLGAMLILFAYISSLAPNEMFLKLNKLSLTINMFLFSMMIFIPSSNPYNFMITSNIMLINKIFSFSMFPLTILMMSFLLITLLSITRILKFNKVPLKMFK